MAKQRSAGLPDGFERQLGDRLAAVSDRIAAAALRAGRAPADITLVAASKTWRPDAVLAAYEAGLRAFGENRVEEAAAKAEAVRKLLAERSGLAGAADAPAWHMIGHVQSRKARDVLPWAGLVHSVDTVRLARRLNEAASAAGRVLPILLEVNVSGEAGKYGLPPAQAPAVVEEIAGLPALRIEGLMTMAPIVDSPEQTRPVFRGLRALLEELAGRYPQIAWRHLSMGMSDDFEVAIEEGATLVRIGRAIFGERYAALRQT